MKRIDVGDVELAVEDRGSGKPVLLVHGFPLDHHMWKAQIESLVHNHRVLAPDLRGFGESGVAQQAGMDDFARDLESLLDQLDVQQPAALCGLSMGGYILFACWRRFPQRIEKLIFCDTRSGPDTPDAAELRRENAKRVLREGNDFLIEGMVDKLFAADTRNNHPQLVAQIKATMAGCSPQGIAAALNGMAERPDSTELLASISVPALFVAGSEDVITPASEMREMAGATPECEFVEVPGAGHMAPCERPAEVNEALAAFLAS